MEEITFSETSDCEDIKESIASQVISSVRNESSSSSDGSLGILTKEQLESDSDNDILNLKNIKLDNKCEFGEFSQNFSLRKSNLEQPDLSPICSKDKSLNIDAMLESTPKIKQNMQQVIDKSDIHKDILNKTINISSIDVVSEETPVKSEKECLEKKKLNQFKKTTLNKTFGTESILNITHPFADKGVDTYSELSSEENLELKKKKVLNETFTESINELYDYKHRKYKFPVEAELLSHTVTKNKSWNLLDSVKPYHQTGAEDKFSQTGTKKKIEFDGKNNKNKTKAYIKGQNIVTNPEKILSVTNRDLKSNLKTKIVSKSILPKKPVNLSFKKVEKEPISLKEEEKLYKEEIALKNEDFIRKSYKETAKGICCPEYKLSLYSTLKEIEKAKQKRRFIDIPTIKLVAESQAEERSDQKIISRSQEKPPCIRRSLLRPEGIYADLPLPGRELSVHTIPQGMPLDYCSVSPKRMSRIPKLKKPKLPADQSRTENRGSLTNWQESAFGPQAIFSTHSPFDPPIRDCSVSPKRMSRIPKLKKPRLPADQSRTKSRGSSTNRQKSGGTT